MPVERKKKTPDIVNPLFGQFKGTSGMKKHLTLYLSISLNSMTKRAQKTLVSKASEQNGNMYAHLSFSQQSFFVVLSEQMIISVW